MKYTLYNVINIMSRISFCGNNKMSTWRGKAKCQNNFLHFEEN